MAFILSLLLPGAGFLYLGKWRWALANFMAALAMGFLFSFLLSDEDFNRVVNPIAFGIGSVSGALAVLATKHINGESLA